MSISGLIEKIFIRKPSSVSGTNNVAENSVDYVLSGFKSPEYEGLVDITLQIEKRLEAQGLSSSCSYEDSKALIDRIGKKMVEAKRVAIKKEYYARTHPVYFNS